MTAAAGLKLAGRGAGSVAPAALLQSPAVEAATVVWELALGLALLVGAVRPLAWLSAVLTFGAFAAVSLSLALAGVADCGCFGAVQASPRAAFAVDVLMLGLLAAGQPQRAEWAAVRHSPAARWAVTTAGVAVVVMAAGSVWAGSPDAALARLRGDTLLVETPSLDLGTGRVGDRLEAAAVVRNYSAAPVRLTGGTADCTCIVTDGLPLVIPPGGRAEVPIVLVIPPSTPGRLDRVLTLYTDRPTKPQLRLRAGCRVGE